MSCFVGSYSIEAHLADVVLHGMGNVDVFFVLRILRVTEFSKVRKSSARTKIVKVLSQRKLIMK